MASGPIMTGLAKMSAKRAAEVLNRREDRPKLQIIR